MTLRLEISGIDFTSYWRVYESKWTMRAWNGESFASQFVLDDDGTISHAHLAARRVVEVWENASGSDVCLFRGRVSNKHLGQGPSQVHNDMRWIVEAEDCNVELRGIRVNNAVRPTETDEVRFEAMRVAFLNGASSTHPEARDSTEMSNTYLGQGVAVNLEAETYTDTDPMGVFNRIVEVSGRTYFVTLADDGTMELYYGNHTDESYKSDIEITDAGFADGADDIDIYAAYRGPNAGEHNGQRVLTGGALRWGDGNLYEASDVAGGEATYDKWEETFTNEWVQHTTQADNVLNKLIGLSDEDFTYLATIDMQPHHVHRLRAGMMVLLTRLRANKPTQGYVRVVQMQVEPALLEDSGNPIYRVHLDLGRAQGRRLIPRGRTKPGPYPADPGGSTPTGTVAHGQDDDGNMDIGVTVGSGADRMLGVLVMLDALPTVTWYPGYINAGTPGSGTALSLVDSVTITGSHTIYYFRLVAPDASTAGTSAVRVSKGAGVRAIAGVWSLIGVDQSTPETDTASNTGTGTTSSVTVTPGANDLVIEVAGWVETNATVTDPAEAGDNTQRFARTINRTFGLPDYALGGADGSDATPAWNFTNSHPWGALAVAVKASNPGSTTQPVGGTGEGTVGDGDGTYVGPEHVHEHGNITTGGPYHMAEDVTAADAGGYFTGTTVEAQLQELGAGSGGSVSTVVAHGAMGATETFDFTDGSDHEGTQDANLTVTLAGATTGEAAWMTLKLTQDGTGGRTLTLPASVVTKSDVESGWDTTASAVNILSLFSYDGGTSWYGFLAGGTSATALDDLTDVTITSPATAQRLRYNGSAWVNSSLVWRPVTTYDGTNWLPAVDGDGNAIISEA